MRLCLQRGMPAQSTVDALHTMQASSIPAKLDLVHLSVKRRISYSRAAAQE